MADAKATVAKVKRVNKPFARKIQILTVLEQRAKVQGKNRQAQIARAAKEDLRAKQRKRRPRKMTKQKKQIKKVEKTHAKQENYRSVLKTKKKIVNGPYN